MIPMIGLMIAGYIVLRCLEITTVHSSHWDTPGSGKLMRIWAGLTLLGTLFLALALLSSSQSLPSRLSGM